MRVAQISKNKVETNFITVNNRETTSVALGSPVVFVMDGTNDGIDVQLPSSSLAAKAVTLVAGIAGGVNPGTLAASGIAQTVQVYGFCSNAKLVAIYTRLSTNSVWASQAASVLGDVLTVDTIANALGWFSAGSSVKAVHPFILASAIASITTIASTVTYGSTASGGASTDTIAYVTSLGKVFIRLM